jgi:heme/copper-type cytochrome/quinol oxidase subunit 2
MASFAAFAALALTAQAAHAESGWHLLNMTQGVTELSRKIYDLHMFIFWVCVIIGVVVFGVMIYSLVKFRKSKGAVPDTTLVHNTKVEIVWTIIPVVILVVSAVPAARTLVQLEDTRNTELTIKVTGFQWGWQYDYLDKGVVFFSRLDRRSDAARHLSSGIDPNTIEHYLLNVDNDRHEPMVAAAQLDALAAVEAGLLLVHVEPHLVHVAGDGVLLDAERRHPPGVNDVVGGDEQAHLGVHGHDERVVHVAQVVLDLGDVDVRAHATRGVRFPGEA